MKQIYFHPWLTRFATDYYRRKPNSITQILQAVRQRMRRPARTLISADPIWNTARSKRIWIYQTQIYLVLNL